MTIQPLFAGLVIDEDERSVDVAYVGETPCYVVDDAGFHRHIPTEEVDRQVLAFMKEAIEGHEDLLTEEAAKMLGQDDIFSRAMIANQLKTIDQHLDELLQTGIPEESRAYMGMMGFRVVINVHGDVVRVDQPGAAASGEEGDE